MNMEPDLKIEVQENYMEYTPLSTGRCALAAGNAEGTDRKQVQSVLTLSNF